MSLTRVLRKHMNKLLWVLVIFIAIAFGVTATMTDVLKMMTSEPWAEMFGREVGYGEFVSARQRLVALRPGVEKMEDEQVWEHLAMLEEAKRTGIVVTTRELKEQILKTFREMRLVEQMRNTSNTQDEFNRKRYDYYMLTAEQKKAKLETIPFDEIEYSKVILSRLQMTVTEFERTYRELLLINKLQSFIWGSAVVASDDVYEKFVEENHQRKIEYLHLNSEHYAGKVKIEEDKLEEFYKENELSYKEPARITFEYVLAAFEDMRALLSEPAEDELKEFYNEKKYSDFRRPPSERPGAEGPRAAQDMYMPYEEVRDAVKDLWFQERAEGKARELVKKVSDEVNKVEGIDLLGVADMAAREGLAAGETRPFSSSTHEYVGKLQDVFGHCPQAPRMFDAVENVGGRFEGPYGCGKGIFAYRLSRYIPEHTKSLAEVRSDVEKAYVNRQAGIVAEDDARRILSEAKGTSAFTDELILKEQLPRTTSDFFKTVSNRGDILTIEGDDRKVIDAAFALGSVGDFAEPVKVSLAGKPQFYLVQYKARNEPNPSEFLGKRQGLIGSEKTEVENEIFEEWKKDLIRRADIRKHYIKPDSEGEPGQTPTGEQGETQPQPPTGEQPEAAPDESQAETEPDEAQPEGIPEPAPEPPEEDAPQEEPEQPEKEQKGS